MTQPFCVNYCAHDRRCRTIALETGMQNAQLCSTITQLSFSAADLELMFAFPLIYSIFQLVVAGIMVGGRMALVSTQNLVLFILNRNNKISSIECLYIDFTICNF